MRASAEYQLIERFTFLTLLQLHPRLTEPALMRLCCSSAYLNFFSYRLVRQEMLDRKLARLELLPNESQRDADGQLMPRWTLTPEGEQLLLALKPTVPKPVLHSLLQAANQLNYSEQEAITLVEPTGEGDVWLVLQIAAGPRLLFETRLRFLNEEDTKELAYRWKQEVGQLYPQMMKLLFLPAADGVSFSDGSPAISEGDGRATAVSVANAAVGVDDAEGAK